MAFQCYYSATAQSSDSASQARAVHIPESQNILAWIHGIMYHCNTHSVQWLQHCCPMLLQTRITNTACNATFKYTGQKHCDLIYNSHDG
jgi:hypothetical protein